jgi:hypothetical protein
MKTWAGSPTGKSYSPVKLSNAKPYWALGADAILKANSQWAGTVTGLSAPFDAEYANSPPHINSGGGPAGGNQVFADGSASWCKYADMYKFTSYSSAAGALDAYWYQSTQDFDAALINHLSQLK